MNSIGSSRGETLQPTAASPSPAAPQAQPQPDIQEEALLGAAWQTQTGPTAKSLKNLAGPNLGTAAILTAGVAAGIGVATLLSGPLGALVAGIAGALGFMSNLHVENKKLREENQALRHRASHDTLTGLPNRGEIFDRLERDLRRTLIGGGSTGVILIDVDFFKKVNDTHGHAAGDEVLREVARRLENSLRPGDSVGRYGGEELLVVLPECELQSAIEVAERLRLVIARAPVATSVASIPVTISLGVAVSPRLQQMAVNDLVSGADGALYRAKRNGRNRVEFYFG